MPKSLQFQKTAHSVGRLGRQGSSNSHYLALAGAKMLEKLWTNHWQLLAQIWLCPLIMYLHTTDSEPPDCLRDMVEVLWFMKDFSDGKDLSCAVCTITILPAGTSLSFVKQGCCDSRSSLKMSLLHSKFKIYVHVWALMSPPINLIWTISLGNLF